LICVSCHPIISTLPCEQIPARSTWTRSYATSL
jgi:hypothetical protein